MIRAGELRRGFVTRANGHIGLAVADLRRAGILTARLLLDGEMVHVFNLEARG
jgi:hypothetical protein